MATPNLSVVSDNPAPEVKRGFGLCVCPSCGEEAQMQVYLSEMDYIRCPSCEDEVSLEQVRDWMAQRQAEVDRWRKVLAWLDTAPPLAE